MKEYKLVILNEELRLSQTKDIQDAEETLNRYVKEGWELQQIVAPNDLGGVMVGVFFREK